MVQQLEQMVHTRLCDQDEHGDHSVWSKVVPEWYQSASLTWIGSGVSLLKEEPYSSRLLGHSGWMWCGTYNRSVFFQICTVIFAGRETHDLSRRLLHSRQPIRHCQLLWQKGFESTRNMPFSPLLLHPPPFLKRACAWKSLIPLPLFRFVRCSPHPPLLL
jgi:hypothetical protein